LSSITNEVSATQKKKKKTREFKKVREITEATATHMLHIPRAVCQAREQD
jgi:hypothetical protein